MDHHRSPILAAALLSLAAACGAPDTEPEPACTPAADDDFCTPYAERFCAAHFACCTDDTLRYAELPTCVARTTCTCVGMRSGAALDDGRVVFDDVAAAALLDRLDGLPASCAAVAPGELEMERLLRGTLAAGADCSPSGPDYSVLAACAPGTTCRILELGDAGVSGQCRALAGAGARCDDTDCAPGLYCAEDGCRHQLHAGVPCLGDYECASDLCDETWSTCAPIHSADGYCAPDAAHFEDEEE